jgi:TolB-like protein
MPSSPNKLSQFWQELKRRNVVRVVTVYAGAAFVIIELINNIYEPLHLPDWTPTLVIVLLALGFPVVIIFSWIYDIHPEGGMVKTEPAHHVKDEGKSVGSNNWKIASYISFAVIVGLVAINIFEKKRGDKIDDSLSKSIAVLPFLNFSENQDQDFMCLGLTDEIINHLYHIKTFDHVTSLTSVLNYRDLEMNIPEIADELRVNYILEGTYKKFGNELKITAQLIEGKSDKHIWQQDYNRPYSDIMAIQSDIALQIADQINVFISKEEKERIEKRPTSIQEAYEIVQRFKVAWMEGDQEDMTYAMSQVPYAVELDPDYAEAQALYAYNLLGKGMYMGGEFSQSELIDARKSIERALELDGESSIAHSANAAYKHFIEWDFIEAEREYLISMQLSKDKPLATSWLFLLLQQMGRPEDALALSVNMAKSTIGQDLRCYITAGRERELMDILRNRPEKYKHISPSLIGELYQWMGEMDSALSWMEQAKKENDPDFGYVRYQSVYASALFAAGKHDDAYSIIHQLEDHSKRTSSGSPAFFVGTCFSLFGQKDSAFYWLERAYKAREIELPWMKVHPAFNSLKEVHRYQDLYKRVGFKAYDDYMARKRE